MKKFSTFVESQLEEGINDPAIFKAVFLAGGPGSGKSFVVGKTSLPALGMKLINSDDAFEAALSKAGMEPTSDNLMSPAGQKLRSKAKALTGIKMKRAIEGRLGLIIDGTGKDYDKIKTQVDSLRTLGYEVKMIFVNTDLDTAIARNRMRPRQLPDDTVAAMWKEVQKNIGKFQGLFRNRLIVVDNSQGNDIDRTTLKVYKQIKNWTETPTNNSIATQWIAKQKELRGIKEAEEMDERVFGDDDSILKTIMPDLYRWLDRTVNKPIYKKAIRTFLDLRKKDPHNAERNLVKTAKIHGLDVRALDKVFKDMVKAGKMPKHLLNFRGFSSEEYGAGFEGTPEATKKLKKDTPGA